MKWLIVPALAAAILSAHTTHATVQAGTHAQKPDAVSVAKALNLTKDQQSKLRDIRVNFLKKILQSMHDENSNEASSQKVYENTLAEINTVLTKEQQARLKDHGGYHALLDMTAAHLELCAPLQLSKSQEARVKKLIDGVQVAKQAIYAEKISPEERHTKVKALVKETMAKLHEIFTPEQMRKAQELMRGGDGR